MIEKLLEFSLKQRVFILLAACLVAAAGVYSFRSLPIDVFPDPSPPLVQIFTEAEGMAPEEMENLISYPIESSMFGLPEVLNIRSVSTFGLSMVNVYFTPGTDIYWARQQVSQRLQEAKDLIPAQAHAPVLGPIATGLGMVYLYYLEAEDPGTDIMELRTLQDWLVKFELKSIPEVSQVLSIGGDVKQYQILLDPQKLIKYDLTVTQVMESVKRNNQNVGASFITKGSEEYIVRSIGLVQSLEDLRRTVLASIEGTPILLKDVADVEIRPAIKRGTALLNGRGERVVGMVLKLFGSNTARVIRDIDAKVEVLNRSLPEGVKIVPFYNQASLVRQCFSTVSKNLLVGILLVILVLFLFMGSFPSALITVLSLPFSILLAFILMKQLGLAADLMSFGGLAIAIGLIADASIILVENIHRHYSETPEDRGAAIRKAALEVARPLFFAISIIILVFLPIFTLTGVEGIMFRPMGYTIAFGLAGSLIFALLFVPALSSLVMRGKNKAGEPFVTRAIKKAYLPFFIYCKRHRRWVFAVTLLLFIAGLIIFPSLGREYIPSLDEGTLHLRVTLDPNISLEETIRITTEIERKLVQIPVVTGVLSRIGRGEVGSHAHFVNNSEILIQLMPEKRRKTLRHKEDIMEEITRALDDFPGLSLNITQPIAHNLDELITGVKAQLAVKIYGDDFDELSRVSGEIRDQIASMRGAADLQVEQFAGQSHIQIRLLRDRIARFGLNIAMVQETIEAAIGGIGLGNVYEQNKRFEIFLRFGPEFRMSNEQIEQLYIPLQGGGRIPLKQVAEVEEVVGARLINREKNKRFITVQCNIRGRDIGGFVAEAKALIRENVDMPAGYLIKWGGQFALQERANRRLALIMPLTLMLVALLLFTVFYSLREVLIILINIPLALTGGIIALKISGLYLSVPASIGFIAIFGIALEDGLVLLTSVRSGLKKGLSAEDSVMEAVNIKMRPVLMTTFTTIFGILPLLLASGPGAEIQRPLATVVIGGLFTSTLVTLVVLPLIQLSLVQRKRP
jgi:cobalt-zinc-cadmium resistance protein CzcA